MPSSLRWWSLVYFRNLKVSSQGRVLKTRGKCQSQLIYEHINMLLPKQEAQLFQKMVMKEEGRGIKVVDRLVKASHLSNCFMGNSQWIITMTWGPSTVVLALIKDSTERKPAFKQILMMHPGKHTNSERKKITKQWWWLYGLRVIKTRQDPDRKIIQQENCFTFNSLGVLFYNNKRKKRDDYDFYTQPNCA